jgi:conjugative transfer signal peptidase TraF
VTVARAYLYAIAAAFVALGASVCPHPTPRLVWNATASAPIGLYRVSPDSSIKRGDLVLVTTPISVRKLAADRNYLPTTVPLVKRIAGAEGDRICANGPAILINGNAVATRLGADRRGRPLPWWHGCRTLKADEIFLLMRDVPDSFDGRYFGSVNTSAVIGKLIPLWMR